MDAKALAKSKRSHSQHHSKKPHPNQTAKASLIAAAAAGGNAKKPPGKQTGEKIRKFHGSSSALPSNWDRYEEEFDSASDDLRQNSGSRSGDAIVPKSKGADFGHLISQAQSQLQSQSQSQSLPNSEIIFRLDFSQGVSPMLSVRGKSILSWIGDDNFIVEDIATPSYEATFLSMDLHALAEQLSKVNLSQRLFIEADLLPPELCAEGSKEISSHESDLVEKTHEREPAKHFSDKLVSHGCADGEEILDQKSEVTSFTTTEIDRLPSQGVKLVDPVKDNSRRLNQTDTSKVAESIAGQNLNTVDSKQKPARFQAAAAEEELDMLLDSFTSGFTKKPSGRSSVVQQEYTTSLLEGLPSTFTGPQPLIRQGSDSSKSVPMSLNLDDAIDDLLGETSIPNNQTEAAGSQEEKAAPYGLLSQHSSSRPRRNSQQVAHSVQVFPVGGACSEILSPYDTPPSPGQQHSPRSQPFHAAMMSMGMPPESTIRGKFALHHPDLRFHLRWQVCSSDEAGLGSSLGDVGSMRVLSTRLALSSQTRNLSRSCTLVMLVGEAPTRLRDCNCIAWTPWYRLSV
ncbi:hypothetical protein HHK36_005256 [Tetracentron sinense]|uniref:Uncharacterized protein n=1 Tax=Tetracentron sinense TaxID=13715 RepID=A0A834ZMV3_TETSI|nr:hypothetical protein HHK36_005256 [Tetracentron sinense]